MAYLTLDRPASGLPIVSSLRARVANMRNAYADYREKREIYERTLRELRSYRPHELLDLGIQSGDIAELARKQAGW